MANKIQKLAIIILIAISLLPVIPVKGQYQSLVSVANLNSHVDNYQSTYFPTDSQLFYTNDAYWFFWSEDNQARTYAIWSNSSDGSSWDTKTEIRTVGSHGGYVTGFYENSTNKIHRRIGQYFRLGAYYDNGTIDYDAGSQSTGDYMDSHVADQHEGGGNIVVDSNGKSYHLLHDSSGTDWELHKNDNTDGTWSDASGYPKNSLYSDTEADHGKIVMDSNDVGYLVWSQGAGSNLWLEPLDSDTIGNNVTLASDVSSAGLFNAVIGNDDLVHVVYLNSSSYLNYLTYNYTSNSTSSVSSVASVQSNSFPLITYDTITMDFYVFWLESAVYYRMYDYSNSSWNDEVQYTDTIPSHQSNYRLNGMDYVYQNGYMGLIVEHGTYQLSFVPFSLSASREFDDGTPPVDYYEETIDDAIAFFVPLLVVLICAFFGFAYGGFIGLVGGVNVGILLLIFLMDLSMYALVIILIVDFVIFTGGRSN